MKDQKYNILKDFDDCLMRIEDIIGDKTTTNTQLLKLGKQLFGDRFKGVYCSDQNFRLKNNDCCIINTDSSKQSGTHWCGIYRYKDHHYIFDSFARDYHTLSRYFKYRHWTNVEFRRIESYKASSCGQLSLTFLLIFDKYKTKCISVI